MNVGIALSALLPLLLFFNKGRFSLAAHVVDLVSTFWHEMSHAITASLLYGEVDSIRLVPGKTVRHVEGRESFVYAISSSGVTNYRTYGGGLRTFAIVGAGYAGPTILSLAMAITWSTFGLHLFGVIWSIILLLFFLVSRGITAILINLVSLLFVAASIAPDTLPVPFIEHLRYMLPTILISTLLLYGFKDALANFKSMREIKRGIVPGTGDSDNEKMEEMTRISASFWALTYVVLSMIGIIIIPSLLIWQNM